MPAAFDFQGATYNAALEIPDLKKSKTPSERRSLDPLQRLARERADNQARRIPWQRLLEARNQYIEAGILPLGPLDPGSRGRHSGLAG